MQKSPYIVKQHMDYLTASVDKFEPFDDYLGDSEPCKPLIGNYNTAVRYDFGAIVQWHTDKPQLKTHITMTGKTLDTMRTYGLTDADIVSHIQAMKNPNVKRIDLAITSIRMDNSIHGFLPHFAHYLALAGWCDTRLTLDKPVTDVNLNIETAYIGNRKKREMLRVYDKGIELGKEANRLIRIELERHSVANSIAKDVTDGNDYGAVINRYVSFPQSTDWLEIVGADKQPRNRTDIDTERDHEAEQAKLWQWLHESVTPSLARALHADGIDPTSNPNAEKFNQLLEYHYNKLVDKSTPRFDKSP